MNKIFRLVWNRQLHQFVAAPETAQSQGGMGSSAHGASAPAAAHCALPFTRLARALMLAWVSIGSAAMAADGAVGYTLIADYTNPTGTTLAGGTATAGTAGTAGANFTGAYVSDDNDGSAGGIGAAGGTGVSSTGSTGFTLTNQGTINGGAGGMGGTGGAGGFADAYPYNHGGAGGAGGQGGSGGAGVSGTGFTLSNTGTIVGGSAG